MAKWKCPKCKRIFANKKQWHSCAMVKDDSFFEEKPVAVKKAYDKILKAVKKFGEVNVSAVKSGIFFKRAGTFVGISLRKDHFKLEFFLNELHDEFPVAKAFQYSKKKFVHVVLISDPKDVDKQLINWLRISYSMTTA